MFLLTQKHSVPIMPVPLSAAWCRGGGIFVMHNKYPATKVVTFLAIVWYVLEIIIKTVQLLR